MGATMVPDWRRKAFQADLAAVRNAWQAGFTLIEMLVTLAIIGIASAVALNGMNGMSGLTAGRRLALTSEVIANEIERLRGEALRTGQRGRLAFEVSSGFFLSSRVGAVPIPTKGALVTIESGTNSRTIPTQIWLLPDGSSTGGRIVLATGGESVVLSVSALTGLVHRTDIR